MQEQRKEQIAYDNLQNSHINRNTAQHAVVQAQRKEQIAYDNLQNAHINRNTAKNTEQDGRLDSQQGKIDANEAQLGKHETRLDKNDGTNNVQNSYIIHNYNKHYGY